MEEILLRLTNQFLVLAVAIAAVLASAVLSRAADRGEYSAYPRFTSSKISLGVYPGQSSLAALENLVEKRFNHVLVFEEVKNLQYYKVQKYLDHGYDVILCITFTDDHANLKEIRDGRYDEQLRVLADKIVKDGRTVWLRPLHEFNGNWDNWDVLYAGNSKNDFIPAWRHVVDVFREKKSPVKFQLNYNRINGVNRKLGVTDPMPFSELYPGDEWVDMVVVSCYNRSGSDEFHTTWMSYKEQFIEPYNQVIALTNKPIGVAEIGTTSYGGDKPQWIIDAFTSFKTTFTRVSMITWFLYNRDFNGTILDWALNTPADVKAFKKGMSILQGR
jgi:hypothetical protein